MIIWFQIIVFFLYCLLPATQSEQKYDPLWACDPQVEGNWIRKHCSTCAFLVLFISPLSSCCVPFVTKLTLRLLRVLVVGVDSFMLRERSLGSNPAQVANYVETEFKGIEVNKKNNVKGLPSLLQKVSLFFWINWAIFGILLIHKY